MRKTRWPCSLTMMVTMPWLLLWLLRHRCAWRLPPPSPSVRLPREARPSSRTRSQPQQHVSMRSQPAAVAAAALKLNTRGWCVEMTKEAARQPRRSSSVHRSPWHPSLRSPPPRMAWRSASFFARSQPLLLGCRHYAEKSAAAAVAERRTWQAERTSTGLHTTSLPLHGRLAERPSMTQAAGSTAAPTSFGSRCHQTKTSHPSTSRRLLLLLLLQSVASRCHLHECRRPLLSLCLLRLRQPCHMRSRAYSEAPSPRTSQALSVTCCCASWRHLDSPAAVVSGVSVG